VLNFLPAPLLGTLTLLLLLVNIAFWCALLYPLALLRLLVPVPAWQRACGRGMVRLAESWVGVSGAILRLTQRIDWDVELPESLSREGW